MTPPPDNNEDSQTPSIPRDHFTRGYRFIDHTADIGILSRGWTLEESFQQLGFGMMEVLISDPGTVEQELETAIDVEADTLEELVVSYLSELLFLFETEGLLVSDFDLTMTRTGDGFRLKAKLRGEHFKAGKHPYPTEIKAVTKHMLTVKEEPPFDITVLFDL